MEGREGGDGGLADIRPYIPAIRKEAYRLRAMGHCPGSAAGSDNSGDDDRDINDIIGDDGDVLPSDSSMVAQVVH